MMNGDPAVVTASDRYHEFMLGLYDLMCEAVERGYDEEAIYHLSKARRFFKKEFNDRHPEWAQAPDGTRALWPDP